ncbi:MAG: hypothetical protein LC781_03975 [Actinobacteria bacterium]|nr:hypothetical protein [Actinomycetota bacterium]
MLREALTGAAAGAVGTVALNAVTYADMALNGRPASSVPDTMAGTLAEKVGLDLSAEGEDPDGETARRDGRQRCSRHRAGRGRPYHVAALQLGHGLRLPPRLRRGHGYRL